MDALVKRDFEEFDMDKSGKLGKKEVTALIASTGLRAGFDWNVFDKNKDGKISPSELLALADKHWKDYQFDHEVIGSGFEDDGTDEDESDFVEDEGDFGEEGRTESYKEEL